MDFRQDINGLRAIAVIMVVLFHSSVTAVSGGYAGVDIFFVISGYLMTRIITGGIARGNFSVIDFLLARARRIIPALMMLCLALLIFGWFVIEPLTYANLARHAAGSLFFISNVQYFFEGGYFAGAAESNWLLHTWSLSVEWQFYMLYPFLILLLRKYAGGRWLNTGLIAGCLLSFALCIAVTVLKPSLAFYMLPTRAWEMLVGGLIKIYEPRMAGLDRKRRNVMQAVGLALIAYACFHFTRSSAWPSASAALPVIGAAAVIAANCGGYSILGVKPLQAIGRWSYSIYLWHWPVIVYCHYIDAPHTPMITALILSASVVLGALSYTLVEKPFQNFAKQAPQRWRTLGSSMAPAVVLAALFLCVLHGNGFASRATHEMEILDTIDARTAWEFPIGACSGFAWNGQIKTCTLRENADPSVLIIGDSQAQAWYPRYHAMEGNGKLHNSLTFATLAGCTPFQNANRRDYGYKCPKFAHQAYELAQQKKFQRIVYMVYWGAYFYGPDDAQICEIKDGDCFYDPDRNAALQRLMSDFARDIAALTAAGHEVYLVLPLPTPPSQLPEDLAKRAFGGAPDDDLKNLSLTDYQQKNKEVLAALIRVANESSAKILDPTVYMCDGTTCPLADHNGLSLYKDDNHLRPKIVKENYDFLDRLMVVKP